MPPETQVCDYAWSPFSYGLVRWLGCSNGSFDERGLSKMSEVVNNPAWSLGPVLSP